MAVYTTLTRRDIETLLQHYNLGELLEFSGITQGVENTNYVIITSLGKFILTLFEKRVNAQDLPFFLDFMKKLQLGGINAPEPKLRQDQTNIGYIHGKPAVIFSFLTGKGIQTPSVQQVAHMGQYLGKLHLASNQFDISRKNSVDFDYCSNLMGKINKLLNPPFADEIENMTEEQSYLQNMLDQSHQKNLPHGVMHLDLFPDNVFFDGDLPCGVIDFYFSATEFRLYDLAITFNAWSFDLDGLYHLEKGAQFLAAYMGEIDMTADEKDCFADFLRLASFRFFSTRLYDWINTDKDAVVVKKDPIEYARINQFHRSMTHLDHYL